MIMIPQTTAEKYFKTLLTVFTHNIKKSYIEN